jgi:hypothetical protein
MGVAAREILAMEPAGSEQSTNPATAVLKHNGILTLYSWITQPITLNIGRWHEDGLEIQTTGLVSPPSSCALRGKPADV